MTAAKAAVTRIVSAQVEVEREHSTETVEVCGNVLMPASPSDEMAVRVTSVVSYFSGLSQADDWTPKVQEQFEAALIDEACVQADAARPMPHPADTHLECSWCGEVRAAIAKARGGA